MSYQPGPDDVKCINPPCGAWYHKALPYCPMCDAPNPPAGIRPAVEVSVPVPEPVIVLSPTSPVTIYQSSQPLDTHARKTIIVIAACVVVVLIAWGAVQIAVMREQQRSTEQIMKAAEQSVRQINSINVRPGASEGR